MHGLPQGENPIDVPITAIERFRPLPREESGLRMMEPKHRIKRRIWNIAHVAPIADEAMNGIMQILQVVIPTVATIRVRRVGKRSIFRLGCDELICQGFEPKMINGDRSRDNPRYFTHDSAFASSLWLDSSG